MKNDFDLPDILLFDCNEKVKEELLKNNYKVSNATFGTQFEIAHSYNENSYVNLKYDYPENMHEYDIFVIDMKGKKIDEKILDTEPVEKNPYLFEIKYPYEYFFASAVTAKVLGEKLPKKGIYIVFASEKVDVNHRFF